MFYKCRGAAGASTNLTLICHLFAGGTRLWQPRSERSCCFFSLSSSSSIHMVGTCLPPSYFLPSSEGNGPAALAVKRCPGARQAPKSLDHRYCVHSHTRGWSVVTYCIIVSGAFFVPFGVGISCTMCGCKPRKRVLYCCIHVGIIVIASVFKTAVGKFGSFDCSVRPNSPTLL